MIIEIKEKVKALEELERADKLIKEARDILWRLPSAIRVEVAEGSCEVRDSVQDNQ